MVRVPGEPELELEDEEVVWEVLVDEEDGVDDVELEEDDEEDDGVLDDEDNDDVVGGGEEDDEEEELDDEVEVVVVEVELEAPTSA